VHHSAALLRLNRFIAGQGDPGQIVSEFNRMENPMRRWLLPLAILSLAAPALAAPGDMSIAVFIAKADALKAKGMLALSDPDMKRLQGEGSAAGQAYRSRLTRERAAGKPSSCPPQGAKISSDQLLAHLRTYPAARRGSVSIKTAMADYFIKTWPCK
jgi:hypothetical protein